MSAIKATKIDGDVSVGRNVAIGGNTIVQGNAHLKGRVRIDGWLEARNIKGPNKGLFPDETKLRKMYPLPHDGWWALVGDTLPALLYIADGGTWVSTGKTTGTPTLDIHQYNEALDKLNADLIAVAENVNANEQNIEHLQNPLTPLHIEKSGRLGLAYSLGLKKDGNDSLTLNIGNGLTFDSDGHIQVQTFVGGAIKADANGLAVNVGNGLHIEGNTVRIKCGGGLRIGADNELSASVGTGLGLGYDGRIFFNLNVGKGLMTKDNWVGVNVSRGLQIIPDGSIAINVGQGLQVDENNKLILKLGGGLIYDSNGELTTDNTEINLAKKQIYLLEQTVSRNDAETLKRIQGTSVNSNPYEDPFKLVTIPSLDAFNSWLDDLHPANGQTTDEKKLSAGFFRVIMYGMQYEVHNLILSWDKNQCHQVLYGVAAANSNGTIQGSKSYNILQREYDGSEWSEWTTVGGAIRSISVNDKRLPVIGGNINLQLGTGLKIGTDGKIYVDLSALMNI